MGRITDFIEIYNSKSTRKSYQTGIIKFLEFIFNKKKENKHTTKEQLKEFEKLAEEYLNSEREFGKDLLNFTSFLAKAGTPPHTANLYIVAVKEWFVWNGIEIPQNILKQLKHKKPKGGAVTEEEIITKDILRKILSNCDIKGKSLFILLASTGMRLNEALSIELDDLRLENDPPEIIIRASYTKTKEKRIVFLTLEAKEYLLQWLEVREKFLRESYDRTKNFRKVNKTPIDLNTNKVFPFTSKTVYQIWHEALEKSNLLKVDKQTKRVTMRPHGLRKFFRTQLVKARIPQEIINALMGHSRLSLDQIYTKFTRDEIVKLWKEHAEPELTIFGNVETESLKRKLKEKEEELKRKEMEIEQKLQQINMRIDSEVLVFKGTVEALIKDKIELECRLKKIEEENNILRERILKLENIILQLLTQTSPNIKIPAETDSEIFEYVKRGNSSLVDEGDY